MDVALGGTFDPIHDGHRALFHRAFELGDVAVGLTTDALAADIRAHETDRPVRPYATRRADLASELHDFADRYDRGVTIEPLTDPTGIASERPALAYIVVSPETAPTAERINQKRQAAGLDPLTIEVVDHVRAADGEIISSTRILRGEIDQHGAVLDATTEESAPE